jgi:hypothetical protein
MKQTAHTGLAAWLLDPARPVPRPAVLRASCLAAYAYAVLPPDAPERAGLRGDYLAALARHQRIKGELVPLLAAWARAGIPTLLFKGFHLAEFVYPVPGARFHGDVDLLVRPEHVERASRIARELGWSEEANSRELGRPYDHNACTLYGPGGAACVDLHRWVLHSSIPWNRVQRLVTEAVWTRSRTREWEGVTIREMDPVDALLVGLVLHRCWGGEHWHLKPHDPVDFRMLCERNGVTREQVWTRARELGADRTLGIFLERCDPLEGVFDPEPPAAAALRRWDRAAFPERGPLGRSQRALGMLHALPAIATGVLAAAPVVREVRLALRRGSGIPELLRSLTPDASAPARGSLKRRWSSVHGVRWAARLLPGRNPLGDCLVRSLATYAALRRQGWPVTFVSGVRRDAEGVVGHAWVELEGRVLRELGEPRNREHYAVNLEFPPRGS